MVGYTYTIEDLVIPATFTGEDGTYYKVVEIGSYAFECCSNLKSVTIPSSVTSIEYNAFHDCTLLTSIGIPNSVKSIGNYAFEKCCNLSTINIDNTVNDIRNAPWGAYNATINWLR